MVTKLIKFTALIAASMALCGLLAFGLVAPDGASSEHYWTWSRLGRVLNLVPIRLVQELAGRYEATRAYRAGSFRLVGTGINSRWLAGISDSDDRPIESEVAIRNCDIPYYIGYVAPEDKEWLLGLGASFRPPEVPRYHEKIVCNLVTGETVDFIVPIESWPCLHEYWMDGFNRKMAQLIVANKYKAVAAHK